MRLRETYFARLDRVDNWYSMTRFLDYPMTITHAYEAEVVASRDLSGERSGRRGCINPVAAPVTGQFALHVTPE